MAKKEVNEILETQIDKVEEKVIEKPKARVKVERTTEVLIMNNTNGVFVYEDERTQTRCKLSKYGEVAYMSVEELLRMKNTHKAILEKFWIRIVDVENEDVSLDDVLKYLMLDNLYNKVLDSEEVDEMLLTYSDEKFQTLFGKLNKEFKNRIVERASILLQEKKFSDIYKMNIMEDYLKNDEFFKEISERKVEE